MTIYMLRTYTEQHVSVTYNGSLNIKSIESSQQHVTGWPTTSFHNLCYYYARIASLYFSLWGGSCVFESKKELEEIKLVVPGDHMHVVTLHIASDIVVKEQLEII